MRVSKITLFLSNLKPSIKKMSVMINYPVTNFHYLDGHYKSTSVQTPLNLILLMLTDKIVMDVYLLRRLVDGLQLLPISAMLYLQFSKILK